jgi:uncharacterized protein (TIGR03437 family)
MRAQSVLSRSLPFSHLLSRRGLLHAGLWPLFALGAPAVPANRTRSQPRALAELPLQGYGPGFHGLAISPDGKTAYVTFGMEDVVLVVDLVEGRIRSAIDVSAAGVMLRSDQALLSADGKLLFVVNHGTENILVIDTQQARVRKVLPLSASYGDALKATPDGRVYIGSPSGLGIVSCADLSYSTLSISGVSFGSLAPSLARRNIVYCVSARDGRYFFHVVNVDTRTVERETMLPQEACRGGINRLLLSPSEDTAYLGWLELQNLGGYGNITAFDLRTHQVAAITAIPDGVSDFAIQPTTGKIYAVGQWEGPQAGRTPWRMHINEWDPASKSITRRLPVSPSSVLQAIQIDPVEPRYAYMTEAFVDVLRKVDLLTGAEVMRVRLFSGSRHPSWITAAGSLAYVGCFQSPPIQKLDLNTGRLVGPFTRPGNGGGGRIFYADGKLYFLGDSMIDVIDPVTETLLSQHPVPGGLRLPAVVFFRDKMAATSGQPGGDIDRVLLIDLRTMTIASFKLDYPLVGVIGGVIPSPDGSKLYVQQGIALEKTQILVLDSSDLRVRKRIDVPTSAFQGGQGGVGDFDEQKRIAYLAGFNSVYKLHLDSDEFLGMLNLYDVYKEMGRQSFGWAACALVGIHLSPARDRLLIASHDGHSVFIYDLRNDRWVPRVVNLHGYDPVATAVSPDRKYMYVVNMKTDTISRVDTATGDLLELIPVTGPASVINDVRHGASLASSPVAPGLILALFGDFGHVAGVIGPPILSNLRLDSAGNVATELAGVKVSFDGEPAPILYAYASQVGVVVPYSVSGKRTTRMQFEYRGEQMYPLDLAVAEALPGIFTLDSSGTGQAAMLNQDGTLNTAANRAGKGSVVVFYATGGGQTDPPGVDGKITTDVLPRQRLPVSVYVQGRAAAVLYAGAAPGMVAGVMQVNIRLPADIPSDAKVTLLMRVGGWDSQPGVTMAVG